MKDKIKDMVRSVLPSTARKSAREGKKIASRKARHNVRQQLHDELFAEDEDLSGALHEIDKENRQEIKNLVSNRRGADKIGSFIRWAEAKTKDIPKDNLKERRDAIANEIDAYSSVITEHALDHFVSKRRLNPHAYYSRHSKSKSECILTSKQMKEAIQSAYELDHNNFNKILKYMRVYPCGHYSTWEEDPIISHRLSLPLVKNQVQPCHKTEKQPILSYTYRQIVKKDEAGGVIDTYFVRESLKRPDPSKVYGEVKISIYGYKEVLIHDSSLCNGFFLIKDQQSLDEILSYFGQDVFEYKLKHLSLLIAYFVELGLLEARSEILVSAVEKEKPNLHRAKAK